MIFPFISAQIGAVSGSISPVSANLAQMELELPPEFVLLMGSVLHFRSRGSCVVFLLLCGVRAPAAHQTRGAGVQWFADSTHSCTDVFWFGESVGIA